MAYAEFTAAMRKTHTILVPNMLPIHFQLLISIFRQYGYNMKLLESTSRTVVEEGLKNVHNDTCYPALLVVGQFMEALKSGAYDPDKTALLITQTGGGCRASNYIHLLRRCVNQHFPQVPVISLNFAGLEKSSGFQLTPMLCIKLVYGVLYGDLLMLLHNQCRPYELNAGDSARTVALWQDRLQKMFAEGGYAATKKIYRQILADFAAIPRSQKKKLRVGIIGEIYVKYSPLANNHLEDFLIQEGCEPLVPMLLEFILYCAANSDTNGKLYQYRNLKTTAFRIGYKYLHSKQMEMIRCIEEHGVFTPPHDFDDLRAAADQYISQGVSMGEGWMITAEMAVLAKTGTENIICTQPFGCLPNHIVAKGMARAIKNAYPNANIVAIDYDPGATRVNQENRIKLMLANAQCQRTATL
jgi:predicted nucleotide-binding protein (sugar kinase/HSP70/actin superfamily)